MEREKIRAKREKKSVVRRSDWGVRKVVQIRAEQSVYYRTTQIEEKIRSEKVDKNGGEVDGKMEDNVMRTATEMQEDNNGGAVEMQDNGDGRKGQR